MHYRNVVVAVIGLLLVLTGSAQAQTRTDLFQTPIMVELVRDAELLPDGTAPVQIIRLDGWADLWRLATGNNRLLRRFGSSIMLGRYDFGKRRLTRSDAETLARLHVRLRYDLSVLLGRDDYSRGVLSQFIRDFRSEHRDELAQFQNLQVKVAPPKATAKPKGFDWTGWLFAGLILTLAICAKVIQNQMVEASDLRTKLSQVRQENSDLTKRAQVAERVVTLLQQEQGELRGRYYHTALRCRRAIRRMNIWRTDALDQEDLKNEAYNAWFALSEQAQMLRRGCEQLMFDAIQSWSLQQANERRLLEMLNKKERELKETTKRLADLREVNRLNDENRADTEEQLNRFLNRIRQEWRKTNDELIGLRKEFQPLLDLVRPLTPAQREDVGVLVKVFATGEVTSNEERLALTRLDRPLKIARAAFPWRQRRGKKLVMDLAEVMAGKVLV